MCKTFSSLAQSFVIVVVFIIIVAIVDVIIIIFVANNDDIDIITCGIADQVKL